jgi:hypothetical protein
LETKETSERIASIAARILNMDNPHLITNDFWEEIREVAGSALSQRRSKNITDDMFSHNAFLKLVFGEKK